MSRKRVKLCAPAHRALLSDTLPFEVPASFSNGNFYKLARELEITTTGNVVRWKADDARADVAIRLLFDVKPTAVVQTFEQAKGNKKSKYRELSIASKARSTIPFQFNICHRGADFRTLSVPHPASQLATAAFLDRYSSTIMYHCSRSEFSIRTPSSVARYTFHDDKLHQTKLSSDDDLEGVEEEGREYEQLGSFFVYRRYNNIYKFFESPQYHRAEKRFDAMVQLDISRCFDSIYTHSLAWALIGKQAVKAGLGASNKTFPGLFDELIRSLNYNETNGIVIGPEFSRIYAECLLQKIDQNVIDALRSDYGLEHKRDYRVFRYLDDYFIFFNAESTYSLFYEVLGRELSQYKLALNTSKVKRYEKPIITELTIAKNGISDVIYNGIKAELSEADASPPAGVSCDCHPETRSLGAVSGAAVQEEQQVAETDATTVNVKPNIKVKFKVDSRSTIVDFKTVLKQSGVGYLEIANFTFAVLEKAITRLIKAFNKASANEGLHQEYVLALIECFEICFFIYAAAPRVNLSIRLVRIINNVVEHCNDVLGRGDLKHRLFKEISGNLVHQVKKNRVLKFKEVENVYLLLGLACLGREYWLEEGVLANYLGVDKDNNGGFVCKRELNYFVITSSLYYMREKVRYGNLRSFIVDHAAKKIENKAAYRFENTESILLFFDLISCPYVGDAIKDRIATVYGLQRAEWISIRDLCQNWFTSWRGLKIGDALDAKRSRDVY